MNLDIYKADLKNLTRKHSRDSKNECQAQEEVKPLKKSHFKKRPKFFPVCNLNVFKKIGSSVEWSNVADNTKTKTF